MVRVGNMRCDYKKCKGQFDDDGYLFMQLDGGYGHFIDTYFGDERNIQLCHKHAHKFSAFLGNVGKLNEYNSTSHSYAKKLPYFHVGWDNHTIGSYLAIIFRGLVFHRSLKTTIYWLTDAFRTHKTWKKVDINDPNSPIDKKEYVKSLLLARHWYK